MKQRKSQDKFLMNNSQWKSIDLSRVNSIDQGKQILELVSDNKSTNQLCRFLRFFCKSTHEFVGEIKMLEVNSKYLRRIFKLNKDDQMLLSYPVTKSQQKYIENISGQNLDLEQYEYFMECDLSQS